MIKYAAPKWIGTVAAAIIAVMIFARPALAHGRLKSSTPAAGAHLAIAPREIRLDFSEVPELAFMRIEMVDPTGKQVRLTIPAYAADSRRGIIAAIQGGLIAGGYTVVWQMGGADGHVVRDRYAFVIAPGAMGIVGAGSSEKSTSRADSSGMSAEHHDPRAFPSGGGFGSESFIYVLIRWSTFTGLLFAIGAISFNQIVLRRMSNASHLRGSMCTTASRRTGRFGLHAAYAVLVSAVLRLAAQSVSMHGTRDMANPYLVRTMIVDTLWGRGWLAQMIATIVAAFAFHRAALAEPGTSAARRGWTGATIAVVLLAFTPAFAGHAAAVRTLRPLPVIADGLHILGAGGWLGSLAMVVLVGIPAALSQSSEQRGPIVADLINAFSPVALSCAGLVAATGVVAAWLHLGSISALWQSRYGQILLIKLFVLSAVALTGAYNWLRVKPSLGEYEGAVRIRRSARIELAIGIAVLLITAILVATPTAMDMKM